MRFVAVGVSLVAAAFGASLHPLGGGLTRQYSDDVAGWTVEYPTDLYLERSSGTVIMASAREVTFATFAPRTAVRGAMTSGGSYLDVDPPSDQSGVFPPDGAAFRIVQTSGGGPPPMDRPETHFPLHLSDLAPPEYSGPRGPRAFVARIEANGWPYSAEAWFGPFASPALHAEIDAVITSLSFPSLIPGSRVGYGFTVLEPATAYPLGSATRVVVEGSPYYLVHAPGGWYALGWKTPGGTTPTGPRVDCRMHVLYAPLRFSCPRHSATWDRIGRVVRWNGHAAPYDQLEMVTAKVGEDGHILISPFERRPAGRAESRLYWPDWQPPR